jgi:DNA-directed RNA polymerase specialized sigma24 family protein
MIAFADAPCFMPGPEQLHARFLALLPRIELHARIYFGHVKCPQRKEDCVQEAVAIAWKWFVRLAERGKDATAFVSALATLAARAVRSGRRVCGQERAKDVLSPLAQRRHGFVVEKLPDYSTLSGTPAEEALRDNTRSEVPAQVAFRLDFPAWRTTLTDRDRRMADDLMVGERTQDVARRFGISPARVSQKRREFQDAWAAFCCELPGDGLR